MKEPHRKRVMPAHFGPARHLRGGRPFVEASVLVIALLFVVLSDTARAVEQNANPATGKPSPFTAMGTWDGLFAMRTLIGEYERDQKARFINFMPIDSDQIPGFLSRRQCDVGMTLDSLLPESNKKEAARFDSRPVGCFVVGVIVNAKSPVRSISLDDLQKVFTSKSTSWKDVGESDDSGRIEPFRPLAISTQGMLFQRKALLGCWFVDPPLAKSACATRRKENRREGRAT